MNIKLECLNSNSKKEFVEKDQILAIYIDNCDPQVISASISHQILAQLQIGEGIELTIDINGNLILRSNLKGVVRISNNVIFVKKF